MGNFFGNNTAGQPGATNGASGISGALQGFSNGNAYGMIALGVGTLASAFPTPNADLNSNNLMAALTRQAISGALLQSGNPYAMAAGAAVMVLDKTGGFSDASQGLGKGTDTANMIASFALPGLGYALKKTDTYEMSGDMATMASGYQGSVEDAQTAEANSGAKLLFGRNKANKMIGQSKARDAMISGIKELSDLDFQAASTMTLNKTLTNLLALQGGYDQAGVRVGKFGMQIERIKNLSQHIKFKEISEVSSMKDGGVLFKDLYVPTTELEDKAFFDSLVFDTLEDILEYQKGGKVKETSDDKTSIKTAEDPANEQTQYLQKGNEIVKNGKNKNYEVLPKDEAFTEFLNTLPDNHKLSKLSDYDTYTYWQLNGRPKDFEEAKTKGMYHEDVEGRWHANTLAEDGDNLRFMKPKHHDTLLYELDFYNSGTRYDVNGNKREPSEKEMEEWNTFRNNYELVDDPDRPNFYMYKRKFADGGLMNVIPEGSLHARLHHMENADNLTKKGIPVVDNEGNQQAEIEHSEIIFNLETTKTLEELCKKYKSDDYTAKEKENFAIEAGKLLSIQIMENTDDRVGLINNTGNEQTLPNN